MELSANCEARIAMLESQLREQESVCRTVKEHLDQVQAEALQKQFDLTELNHPTFFQRHFGNLRKQKDAAWAAYQEAVLVLEQAKLDLAEQNQRLAQLKAEYAVLLSDK